MENHSPHPKIQSIIVPQLLSQMHPNFSSADAVSLGARHSPCHLGREGTLVSQRKRSPCHHRIFGQSGKVWAYTHNGKCAKY